MTDITYYDVGTDSRKPITQEMVNLLEDVATEFMLLRQSIGDDRLNGFEPGPALTKRLLHLAERREKMRDKAV